MLRPSPNHGTLRLLNDDDNHNSYNSGATKVTANIYPKRLLSDLYWEVRNASPFICSKCVGKLSWFFQSRSLYSDEICLRLRIFVP